MTAVFANARFELEGDPPGSSTNALSFVSPVSWPAKARISLSIQMARSFPDSSRSRIQQQYREDARTGRVSV